MRSVKCEVWSVKSEVWSAKCEGWSGCQVWPLECQVSLGVTLQCHRARVMIIDQNGAAGSHKARTHGPGWRTAHTSSIDEKGLIG